MPKQFKPLSSTELLQLRELLMQRELSFNVMMQISPARPRLRVPRMKRPLPRPRFAAATLLAASPSHLDANLDEAAFSGGRSQETCLL
jgi:hypothetical protein